MIVYMDTSALIKLYVKEEGSELASKMLRSADLVATSKIAYVEARAALARLWREEILKEQDYKLVKESFQQDWNNYLVVELSDMIINMGGELTETYKLRGFDAIHLASVLMLKKQLEQEVTGGCWDARLWDAFKDHLDVFPSERPGQ